MQFIFCLIISAFISSCDKSDTTAAGINTFVGCTPAHMDVRLFLDISATDSIDFIRWKVLINKDNYELSCQYGISKGGTPGFINEKSARFKGKVTNENHILTLHRNKASLQLLEVNNNLLHLLDHKSYMLVGNGGYSFVLNNEAPVVTNDFNIIATSNKQRYPLVFEGRTPCQELSAMLKLNKGNNCPKLKWYFLFYADATTGKPSYYLQGGMGYRKETMERGKWEINTLKDGRIIYQITPDNGPYTLNLLKGDDNILFFIRPDGSMLVGNDDFSYTLNRRDKEYGPIIQ